MYFCVLTKSRTKRVFEKINIIIIIIISEDIDRAWIVQQFWRRNGGTERNRGIQLIL